MVRPGKKIATIPNTINMRTATNSTPPITVKSHFVWNANNVNPRQTPAVMPTAINTSFWLYLLDDKANKNDCATVNNPKKMKFIGAFLLTLPQHDIAIIVTIITPNEIQNNSG